MARVVAPLDQRYELPAEAVSVTLPPAQKLVEPLAVIVVVGTQPHFVGSGPVLQVSVEAQPQSCAQVLQFSSGSQWPSPQLQL